MDLIEIMTLINSTNFNRNSLLISIPKGVHISELEEDFFPTLKILSPPIKQNSEPTSIQVFIEQKNFRLIICDTEKLTDHDYKELFICRTLDTNVSTLIEFLL